MIELTLFSSTALMVFALGFQQLNVQGNHRVLAVLTSFFIGGAQIYLWRAIPSATPSEIIATLAGGPVGILAAMEAHPSLVHLLKKRRAR